ncbi:MAG: hypothetical protein HY226_03525 [Candidatus Vogelbacteria bacterium]|nr:hypothetical protein [Candidatus Vogelbacteria bacterium]
MHIHFVCTGNLYRSRLAEAYLRSKNIPGLYISSSGVLAADNTSGPVSWYTIRLLKYFGIVKDVAMVWTQTTRELLEQPDLIIFMEPFHLETSKDKFGYEGQNFEVWHIKDIDQVFNGNRELEQQCIFETEATFQKIRESVDGLIMRIGSKP